jgi:ORF6N domain
MTVINKIYFISNQKVMIDLDLAGLYGVETKRLKEQVKRNIHRFLKILCLNYRKRIRELEVAICDHQFR